MLSCDTICEIVPRSAVFNEQCQAIVISVDKPIWQQLFDGAIYKHIEYSNCCLIVAQIG